jgi:hypothetical protein
MTIQSARFSLLNNWENQSEVQQQLADVSIIFTGEEGCGYCIERRIDADHIQVVIWTSPDIMDMIMQDARFELIKKLEGWPEENIEIPEM